MFYCTVDHQASDWPKHKSACRPTAAVGVMMPEIPPACTPNDKLWGQMREQNLSPSACDVKMSMGPSAELAHGSYGRIIRYTTPTGNNAVVVKEMKVIENGGLIPRQFLNEMEMRGLNHPNVVGICSAEIGEDVLAPFGRITMDHYYQDLEHLVHASSEERKINKITSGPFSEIELQILAYQLLRGLAYCHSQGVVNRDIKPANMVLVGTDRDVISGIFPPTNLKKLALTDFGFAKGFYYQPEEDPLKVYTHIFRPPECWKIPAVFSDKSDVWAAGCSIFYMATGIYMFQMEESQMALFMATISQHQLDNFVINNVGPMHPNLDKLLCKMITVDPLQRIDAFAAMNDAYFDRQVIAYVEKRFPTSHQWAPHARDPESPLAFSANAVLTVLREKDHGESMIRGTWKYLGMPEFLGDGIKRGAAILISLACRGVVGLDIAVHALALFRAYCFVKNKTPWDSADADHITNAAEACAILALRYRLCESRPVNRLLGAVPQRVVREVYVALDFNLAVASAHDFAVQFCRLLIAAPERKKAVAVTDLAVLCMNVSDVIFPRRVEDDALSCFRLFIDRDAFANRCKYAVGWRAEVMGAVRRGLTSEAVREAKSAAVDPVTSEAFQILERHIANTI